MKLENYAESFKVTDSVNEPHSKRRTNTEITFLILEYLNDTKRAKKTWLINISKLNTKNFQKLFDNLLDKNFIKRDGHFFILTEIGKMYMNKLKSVIEFDSKTEILNLNESFTNNEKINFGSCPRIIEQEL